MSYVCHDVSISIHVVCHISLHVKDVLPSAPPIHCMDDQLNKSEEQEYPEHTTVTDFSNGGMWWSMRYYYHTSFWLEALVFRDGDLLMIAQSSKESNIVSRYQPAFMSMALWVSEDAGHVRTDQGIPTLPPFDQCIDCKETILDRYGHLGQWQHAKSMEDVLSFAGITEYVRCICGYHIHGEKADKYGSKDGDYCPLDWYVQTSTMQVHNDDRINTA